MFNALSQHEQLAILDPKTAKQQLKTTNVAKSPEPSTVIQEANAQIKAKQEDDGSATVRINYNISWANWPLLNSIKLKVVVQGRQLT